MLVTVAVLVPLHLATEHGDGHDHGHDGERERDHEGPDHASVEHDILATVRPAPLPPLDLRPIEVGVDADALIRGGEAGDRHAWTDFPDESPPPDPAPLPPTPPRGPPALDA